MPLSKRLIKKWPVNENHTRFTDGIEVSSIHQCIYYLCHGRDEVDIKLEEIMIKIVILDIKKIPSFLERRNSTLWFSSLQGC